jgi:DNA-directed RNA polymerase subunit RPC12/RpoP
MNFNCPKCNKSGNIDDTKMPESGVYATCPQCNNKFLIKPEASKDFVYETVVQDEPQQALLKETAASIRNGGGASTFTPNDAESQNSLKISAKAVTSRISTKPLEFFFMLLFLSSIRLITKLSASVGLLLGGLIVGILAICGVLLGRLVGKFIVRKLNASKLQRTHKILSAWAICIASFVLYITFLTLMGGPLQNNTASKYIPPPVQTNSQPEYLQQQTTEKLPHEPITPGTQRVQDGFRFDDAVVSDTRTGLMWTRDANIAGQVMTHLDALKWVKSLSVGGYRDWRLPTVSELLTMKHYFEYCPAESLNRLGFAKVQKGFYWHSEIYAYGEVGGRVSTRFGNAERQEAERFAADPMSIEPIGFASVWPVRYGK